MWLMTWPRWLPWKLRLHWCGVATVAVLMMMMMMMMILLLLLTTTTRWRRTTTMTTHDKQHMTHMTHMINNEWHITRNERWISDESWMNHLILNDTTSFAKNQLWTTGPAPGNSLAAAEGLRKSSLDLRWHHVPIGFLKFPWKLL